MIRSALGTTVDERMAIVARTKAKRLELMATAREDKRMGKMLHIASAATR